jgi:signal peptidase I
MSKNTPSSEALLKAEGRSSRATPLKAESRSSSNALLKAEGHSSSETLLKAEGCSSSEALREDEVRSSSEALLKAESRSSTESNMFFKVTVDLLKNGQSVRFQAPGRSMTPTIREDETITIDPVSASSVRKGDIILYNNETGVIAHRVVNIEHKDASLQPHSFILRGDASITDDKPVAPGQVLGKVVSVERHGRSIALCGMWAKTKRMTRLMASRLKRLLKPLIIGV